jgi:tetratricopeptide (TPR) repeat protein
MKKLFAMAVPILPGKTAQWKNFTNELMTSYATPFAESRKQLKVHERTFFQSTPMGDFVIVTLEGDDPDARRRTAFQIRLGDLSLRLREPAQAVTWYQRAVETSGADVSLLVRIAEAHLQAGATEAAFATIQKALEKDPVNKDALALLHRIRPITVPFSDQRGPEAHRQES